MRVELDSTDERFEESVDHLRRKTLFHKRIGRGNVVVLQECPSRGALGLQPQQSDACLVEDVAHGCKGRRNQLLRVAERITENVVFLVTAHECARFEITHLQLHEVDFGLDFRVGGEQHLETTVEAKAVDDVGTNPTADAIACLENRDSSSCALQVTRTLQSGQTCTDDDDVGLCRIAE